MPRVVSYHPFTKVRLNNAHCLQWIEFWSPDWILQHSHLTFRSTVAFWGILWYHQEREIDILPFTR